MFRYVFIIACLTFYSASGLTKQPLPQGHSLLQNELGEYYVENKKGVVMIDPAILAIGHQGHWIVACVKNDSIDTEPKRYYFINLKIGGTTDTINQENWEYFQTVYEDLGDVEIKPIVEEPCP